MIAESLLRGRIRELVELYTRRELSPVEVTAALFDRIHALDPTLNAFTELMEDAAMDSARRCEDAYGSGSGKPPLLGVPVSVKDIFDVQGRRTSCASGVTAGHVATSNAHVVSQLCNAGTVLLGKNNLLEFAYGGVAPEYGAAQNPWDKSRTAGGSSSGSAVSVAVGMTYASIGTDTAGSIRGPASFCGVVGHKPTYDIVSRDGMVPVSWSLDYAGPLARTVEDAALIMDAIADPGALRLSMTTSHGFQVPSFTAGIGRDVSGIRIGVLTRELEQGVEPEVRSAVEAGARVLENLGAQVDFIDIPGLYDSVTYLLVILMAEAASYHEPLLRQHAEAYSPEVRHRIETGSLIPAIQYLRAQRLRTEFCRHIAKAMQAVDFLLLPTAASVAMSLEGYDILRGADEVDDEAKQELVFPLYWRLSPFDLTGQPALTLPCGFSSSGLPVGMQIVGKPYHDADVFAVAHAYEQATPWHTQSPPM